MTLILGNYYNLKTDSFVITQCRLINVLSNFIYSFSNNTYDNIDSDDIFEQFTKTGEGYHVYMMGENKFVLSVSEKVPDDTGLYKTTQVIVNIEPYV